MAKMSFRAAAPAAGRNFGDYARGSTAAENNCIFAHFANAPADFPGAGPPLVAAPEWNPKRQNFESRDGVDAVTSALSNDALVDTWKVVYASE